MLQYKPAPAQPPARARLLGLTCCPLGRPLIPPQELKAESDQRYLSISAFLWAPPQAPQPNGNGQLQRRLPQEQQGQGQGRRRLGPRVFVAAAASDASLDLLCADLAACRGRQLGPGRHPPQWRRAAMLEHHSTPVLCTAQCSLAVPACSFGSHHLQCHVVCSGATDGVLAVWDVTDAAAAAGEGGGGCPAEEPPALAPLLALTGLHQSGLNDVAVASAGEAAWSAFVPACVQHAVVTCRHHAMFGGCLACVLRCRDSLYHLLQAGDGCCC